MSDLPPISAEPPTRDEPADLRAQVEHLETAIRHQQGLLVALYNGLNQLGHVFLNSNRMHMQIMLNLAARRTTPEDFADELKAGLDAFGQQLLDIHVRLSAMNDYLE